LAAEADLLWGAAPDGGVLLGHPVRGEGLRRVVVARQGSPQEIAVVGAGPLRGGLHHGVNARGLVLGVRAGSVAASLASSALERAGSVPEALDVVADGLDGTTENDVALWLVDRDQGAMVTAGSGGVGLVRLPRPAAMPADLRALIQSLRVKDHSGDSPGTVSTLVAHLAADGTVAAHICLGPPRCGIFVRYWPGIEVGPAVAGSPDGPPEVAALAAALAARVDAGLVDPSVVRQALDSAEAATLAEGDEAERMARIMDDQGDHSGAAARRVVAVGHSLDIALEALRRLLGPAAGADL